MARYIDADALIKKIFPMGIGDGMYTINAKAVKFAIDNAPTADVVAVVRCKDCVAREEFDTHKYHCTNTGYYCGETAYCSDGVRKTQKEGE